VKPGEPGHDHAAVVARRQEELEASCRALNITHLELLGYADSGMMGWAANDAPGAFWRTPVDEAAARLADLIRRYEPDVIVTYDEFGFYGHPDHIQANRITMAAVAATGIPAKVYWTTAPLSRMDEFAAVVREFGGDWDEQESADDTERPAIGLPDDQITTWVDVTEFGGQKFDALAAHASQSDNIFFLKMGKERFTDLMGIETFVLVQDKTGSALPEDDLFAGLR
jgi:LmbE family N-acetylglucosaminyl deacetylase